MKKIIFHLIFILIITGAIADKERADEIPYNGLDPSSNSFRFEEYPVMKQLFTIFIEMRCRILINIRNLKVT